MITTEAIAKWAAKNRNALFLMVCVALGQVYLYFTTTAAAERKSNQYKALHIAGRVDKVMPEGRTWQRVRLVSGETQSIATTVAGQQYLQAGDSLVKEAGSAIITTYRRFSAYTEVSVFGPNSADNKGLIRRYQIKKP